MYSVQKLGDDEMAKEVVEGLTEVFFVFGFVCLMLAL